MIDVADEATAQMGAPASPATSNPTVPVAGRASARPATGRSAGRRGSGPFRKGLEITLFVAPESWEAKGGQGTICRVEGVVIIRQPRAIQQKIRRFLTEFKRSEETPFKGEDHPQPGGGGRRVGRRGGCHGHSGSFPPARSGAGRSGPVPGSDEL